MARRCSLSGKGVLTGNHVSHANNKSRRRFLPNIRSRRLYSETLGIAVRLKIATSSLRTIEKLGGLDAYLLGTSSAELGGELGRLRQQIEAKRAAA
jgi:large subunit ribosomal protein L28